MSDAPWTSAPSVEPHVCEGICCKCVGDHCCCACPELLEVVRG